MKFHQENPRKKSDSPALHRRQASSLARPFRNSEMPSSANTPPKTAQGRRNC